VKIAVNRAESGQAVLKRINDETRELIFPSPTAPHASASVPTSISTAADGILPTGADRAVDAPTFPAAAESSAMVLAAAEASDQSRSWVSPFLKEGETYGFHSSIRPAVNPVQHQGPVIVGGRNTALTEVDASGNVVAANAVPRVRGRKSGQTDGAPRQARRCRRCLLNGRGDQALTCRGRAPNGGICQHQLVKDTIPKTKKTGAHKDS
jgi:hypothetical protein